MNLVRKISIEEFNRVIDILAKAFHKDPLWLYLMPNEKKREKYTRKFFKAMVFLQYNKAEYYGVSDPIKGIALWQFPHPPILKKERYIKLFFRSGVLGLLFSDFASYFIKALPLYLKIARMKEKYTPEPHYYLSTIAIHPKYQGKGFASPLINHILNKADKEHISAYLETVTPGNVPIYQHFGFKIMERVEIPKKNLTLWCLYRPAK